MEQKQPYQQDEKQDMHNQYQQQPYPYQQLHQQPDQQPPYSQQPYPQQAYPQQQQQQQLLLNQQPVAVVAPQPAMNWVYTDLPEQRLKTLGIIQLVIGSIFFVLNIFNSGYNILGYCWSVLILGSGIATLVTLRRKDKLMVVMTGVVALCTAILTAIFMIFSIIAMSLAFIFMSDYGSVSGSSYGSGSNYGSNSGYGSYDRRTQTAFGMVYILLLIVFIASIAIQGCVLTISIMLAVVSRRIVQTKRPVPPNSGAPVTLVTYGQA